MQYTRIALAVAGITLGLSAARAAEPRHVIVMISDGASFNTWRMASLYEGKLGKQPYEQDGFVRFPATTYPLNTNGTPTGGTEQRPNVVYNPEKAWKADPTGAPASMPAAGKPQANDCIRLFGFYVPCDQFVDPVKNDRVDLPRHAVLPDFKTVQFAHRGFCRIRPELQKRLESCKQ